MGQLILNTSSYASNVVCARIASWYSTENSVTPEGNNGLNLKTAHERVSCRAANEREMVQGCEE